MPNDIEMNKNTKNNNRRSFLKGAATLSAGLVVAACASEEKNKASSKKKSKLYAPSTNKSVMDLVVSKMAVVRIGWIGVGRRGTNLMRLMCNIEGTEIKAICDVDPKAIERGQKLIHDAARPAPAVYSDGENAYKDMIARDDIDIVLVVTPWRWHTPMATDVMNAGKHAFVEVPAAFSMEECWELVDTSEKTQMNCMMMENCCYNREEMMVLNMVRHGVFGELLHAEGAYVHELRWQMNDMTEGTGSWRTDWHAKPGANLYPTHGLGPIAQYLDINRGDRLDFVTSVNSPALGRQIYAKENFGADHKRNQETYMVGDMNTSIIKTVKGRSIMIQHDTTTPRPYSRHNMIQGTDGIWAGYPQRIALDEGNPHKIGEGTFHKWDKDVSKYYDKFEHPLWSRMKAEAKENGGHGGMDFVMLWRMIYCLRNALPLDQNVYDAAAWSALVPLSLASVNDRSASKDFPDFTRELWKTAKPVEFTLF
jgi:hypothetical protein